MAVAVWEFMWCLDKITRIDDEGYGWVLGGKPINLEDFTKDLGIHRVNISRHLTSLEEDGYIGTINTPYGIRIWVNKAQKSFSEIAKPVCEIAKPNIRLDRDNTAKTNTAAEAAKDWTLDELSKYIKEMNSSNNRAIQIIAMFLGWKIG